MLLLRPSSLMKCLPILRPEQMAMPTTTELATLHRTSLSSWLILQTQPSTFQGGPFAHTPTAVRPRRFGIHLPRPQHWLRANRRWFLAAAHLTRTIHCLAAPRL